MMRRFFTVTSGFYPELMRYYDRVIEDHIDEIQPKDDVDDELADSSASGS